MNEYIIQIKNLKKEFTDTSEKLVILENVNLNIKEGEKIAIIGSSGSGKSTFLALLAGLDKPSSGEIIINDKDISKFSNDQLSEYRNTEISMIFQSFELISPFNALENVSAPLEIKGENYKNVKETSINILKEVGLSERIYAFPNTLSGGERQRVAIARSLAINTPIILADEPTGSLDEKTGENVLNMLLKEVSLRKKTLIIITHDMKIAEKMDRIYELKDKTLNEKK
jgi:putative ABC transport system ATP-binding protein